MKKGWEAHRKRKVLHTRVHALVGNHNNNKLVKEMATLVWLSWALYRHCPDREDGADHLEP